MSWKEIRSQRHDLEEEQGAAPPGREAEEARRSVPTSCHRAPGAIPRRSGSTRENAGPPVGQAQGLGEQRPDLSRPARAASVLSPRTAARNSCPPSIRSSSAFRSLVAELLDPRVRRLTRHLLDPEMTVGERRDLRQVGDRDHLCPLREPLQSRAVADRHFRVEKVPGDPTHTRIEHHRPGRARGDELERMLGGAEFLATLARMRRAPTRELLAAARRRLGASSPSRTTSPTGGPRIARRPPRPPAASRPARAGRCTTTRASYPLMGRRAPTEPTLAPRSARSTRTSAGRGICSSRPPTSRCSSERSKDDRTLVTVSVSRGNPATAVKRLYDLVQTAAEL